MSKKSTPKVKAVIEWPTTHFTIEDMQAKYPDVINITLRFRVKRAEEDGVIVLIGKVKPPIGRPRKVYAKANPSKELIEAAIKAGMISATVKVAEVNVSPSSTETSPKVTA